jgi:hypothetical protein
MTVKIANRGEVVLAAKLVASGSAGPPIRLAHRAATEIGVAAPVPPAVATAPNKGVATPAAVTITNVVLRFAVVLIDPVEDVDQDGAALDQRELDGRQAMRTQFTNRPVEFLAGLHAQPVAGEELLIGGGAHDLIASLPYQAAGISFDGTLTLRDLSGKKFDAKVAIRITDVEPPCFVIVVMREDHRPIHGRTRPLGKPLYFYNFSLRDKENAPLADAALELTVDAPEEGYRRQRITGTCEAGHAIWTFDGRKHGVIALPEKTYQVLRASRVGHVSRNYFEFPGSGQPGSNMAATEIVINLWTTQQVGAVLAAKNFNLDSGHGIAYGADGNKARVQEWYVCDQGLQRTRKTLTDWGVPTAGFAETRSAGILFDEFYWKLNFGAKTDNPRIYTLSVNPARNERYIDDLVVVLALDTPAAHQDFLDRNRAVLATQARRLIPVGAGGKPLPKYTVGDVQWQADQLVAPLDDGSGNPPVLTRLKQVDHTVRLEFGRHDQRDLFIHLVETRLADQTMDVCLRWNGKEGEITTMVDAVDPVNWDRDYIRRRIVEQAKQPAAFDHEASVDDAWLHAIKPLVRTAPQPGEAKRPATAGQWNGVLLGWLADARIDYWHSLRPRYAGNNGVIVTLHLNADDDHNAARGCHTEYDKASSKIWAQLMAKYVDPMWGGMRSKVGYGHKTGGKTFFDSAATDVFIEADFQNSVLGNFLSRKPHTATEHVRWVWREMIKPEVIQRLGDGIAEAIAEGFCYVQAMGDW